MLNVAMLAADSSRVQNPIGNLPMHQNPFASFQEVSLIFPLQSARCFAGDCA